MPTSFEWLIGFSCFGLLALLYLLYQLIEIFRDFVSVLKEFITLLIRQDGSIDKMRLHRFRHTVGTLLAAEGREIIQIMRQLGITQEKTLQRYIDKKGNQKIIAGNVDAISKGLFGMLNQSKVSHYAESRPA